MKVEQFVMAYQVEQDRLRAMLPEGFESLRPVLRINAEILGEGDQIYVELNTPVAGYGKRGWLNVAHWGEEVFHYKREGEQVTFYSPFLRITYTGVGIQGGCPAERDNDGCFFREETLTFLPKEEIASNRTFCNCSFAWHYGEQDAQGVSVGSASLPAIPTAPQKQYDKQPLSAPYAASIPCEQILGSYTVTFEGERPQTKCTI